jgi:UDP-GlcNAc:undecaprenyl-phosphate GlcNAc-1-phosphate transferase
MVQGSAIPYLVVFGVSTLVVWVTVPIVRRLGLRAGVVDRPNDRKMHSAPVVRLGGVSIFLGSLVALLLAWDFGWFGVLPSSKDYEIWGVTIGGLAFFLVGLADDIFNLSAGLRLVLQLAIAALAWHVGVSIDFITIPFVGVINLGWLSLPITVVWLAGMANAINWIDGLDGLAAGVSAIAAAVILVASLFMDQPAAALIAAALAGGCLGFLRYNFKFTSAAEIFMGDGGAYYLGFTLAGVSVLGLVKSVTTVAVILPYIILAVPILDGSAVLLERWRRGESLMGAGKHHLHHRLVRAGLSKRRTVIYIYALTLWVGSLALAFSGMPAGGTYAVVTTVIMAIASYQVIVKIRKQAKQRRLAERELASYDHQHKHNGCNQSPLSPSNPSTEFASKPEKAATDSQDFNKHPHH